MPTQSPWLIPRSSASWGWISNTSSPCHSLFSVRRVWAPTLYCDSIRPVVSSSGNLRLARSVVAHIRSWQRSLCRAQIHRCMMGVPLGVSSLHGHWMLPSCSKRSYDTPLKVGVRRAISSIISEGWLYSILQPRALARAMVPSQSALPLSGGMTLRTLEILRSALVKVPSFSKNEAPGKNTWANLAVSLRKISCTTKHSMARSAASTCWVLGSDWAISSPWQ